MCNNCECGELSLHLFCRSEKFALRSVSVASAGGPALHFSSQVFQTIALIEKLTLAQTSIEFKTNSIWESGWGFRILKQRPYIMSSKCIWLWQIFFFSWSSINFKGRGDVWFWFLVGWLVLEGFFVCLDYCIFSS